MMDVRQRPEPAIEHEGRVDEVSDQAPNDSSERRNLAVFLFALADLGHMDELDAKDHLADALSARALDEQ